MHFTLGVICCTETFMNKVYKECLSKIFEKDENGELLTAFNATLSVPVSLYHFSFHDSNGLR